MLPPESLEGKPEIGSMEDGESATADVLIALVSPVACALFGLEVRGAVRAASEAFDRSAIAMDLTNSVRVAPANRAAS